MKKLVYKKTSEIKPYFRNPRRNEEAILKVAESIQAFGFQSPILCDENFLIIAGHTRWKAALKLDLEKVPVVTTDELDEVKKRAYRIADNKYQEFSDWDFPLLKDEFADLDTGEIDLELTGFNLDEIEEMMTLYGDEYQGNIDDDAIPEEVETRCKLGDLWQLGRHRLLCGDATKSEDVEKLMDGQKADMVFTDPPYNVNYSSKNELLNLYDKGNHIQTQIKNDNMINAEEYQQFIKKFFDAIKPYLSDYNAIYICGNYESLIQFYKMGKLKCSNMLVWIKNVMVLGRMDYQNQHEFIFYGWYGKHKWYGDRKQTTVWYFNKPLKSELHPTMKPVELIINAILNSTKDKNSIVVDIFLGSGSTLIACEKTKRICYGMEIDPHYCDVIIKRWEDYTGNKAELINA